MRAPDTATTAPTKTILTKSKPAGKDSQVSARKQKQDQKLMAEHPLDAATKTFDSRSKTSSIAQIKETETE